MAASYDTQLAPTRVVYWSRLYRPPCSWNAILGFGVVRICWDSKQQSGTEVTYGGRWRRCIYDVVSLASERSYNVVFVYITVLLIYDFHVMVFVDLN